MNNVLLLTGRIANNPTIKELDNNKKVCNVLIAVQRDYKNSSGEYETDFFSISLWNGYAESAIKYIHKGDLINIFGRLQNQDNKLSIVIEKIKFLASKPKNDTKIDEK